MILAMTGCYVQKKSKPQEKYLQYTQWSKEVIIDYHTFNINPQFAKK